MRYNLENVKGPILLFSGEDEQTWPSSEMASVIEQRLRATQFGYPVRNVTFPDAGHWLLQFRKNFEVISGTFFRVVQLTIKGRGYKFNNGGSAWATMTARRKSRSETFRFLEHFK